MKRQTQSIQPKKLLFAAIVSLVFLFTGQTSTSAQNNPYFEAGVKLFEKELYKDAIVQLQKSNALVGETFNAYALIGYCFNRLKQYEEAIPNFRKAIALKPDDGKAYLHLGEAFYRLGRNEEALVSTREAARLLPNDAEIAETLSLLETVIAENKTGLRNSGNNNTPLAKTQTDEFYEQGLALFRKEDYKKAIKLFEQSLKLNPNNWATFYNLGSAYYNTNQFTKSAKAYQETLRLNPNHPTAKQDLADAQNMMREEKAAREAAWAKLADSMKNNRATQSTNASARRSNEDKEEGEEASTVRGNIAANDSLPAGKYECRTLLGTMLIQGRDSFRINSNGTYQVLNQNNAAAPYSYDSNSGAIQWRGDGFSRASKSWFDADRGLIFIRLGNEVWDCGIRGPQ